jgi:hypothetical protein
MAIDFDRINQFALASLSSLVERWLPGGRMAGSEYCTRNPTRTDHEVGSFSINVHTGKWSDFATNESGGDPVSLYDYINNMRQGEAAKSMAQELGLEATTPDNSPTKEPTPPKKSERRTWTPIIPVPVDAPQPPTKFTRKESGEWKSYPLVYCLEFRDKDNQIGRASCRERV